MWFTSWLRNLKGSGPGERLRTHSSPRRRATFRPRVEALEERWLPSQMGLTVSSLADSGAGTLRAAILAADDGSPSDKFTIGFSVSGTIDLQSPLPDLTNSIAIQGPGQSSLTVERDTASPFTAAIFTTAIFTVDAGQTASISGLTIAKGDAGGITNEGTLTVADSTIKNCSAAPQGPHSFIFGGGIENLVGGTLTVSGCTLSGDSAPNVTSNNGFIDAGEGGGIDNQGTTTITGSTLCGDSAFEGGGIRNTGTLTVSDCTLSGNNGDGIFNLFGGTLAVTGSKFTGNTATPGNSGGGIENDEGKLTVADSTFCGNSASDSPFSSFHVVGGAIDNFGATATVTDCTLSNNSASFGGGISSFGTLVVRGSTLCGNSAVDSGGGIDVEFGTATLQLCTLSGNSAGATGGGLFNPGNTVTVTDSTLSGNFALSGGGIWNGISATLGVRGSTFSGNTASDSGGGIYNLSTATVQGSTLSGNTAGADGGGLFNGASATLAVRDSTVLGNTAPSGADIYNLGALTLGDSTVGVTGP
jgi:predicted outer membrane repeat protein